MSLGVGRATPFSQGSNYHTAFNHSFRSESPFSIAAQHKMKCTYCGVWGKRGSRCTLCAQLIPGFAPCVTPVRSRSPGLSARRTPLQASSVNVPQQLGKVDILANIFDGPQRSVSASTRATTARSSSATQQSASQQLGSGSSSRVKCVYCGIWVRTGRICTLCRTQN